MTNIIELYQTYPKDLKLQSLSNRDELWLQTEQSQIADAVGIAITSLDLDKPWEQLASDPLKMALADALFSSSLACFGPKIHSGHLKELNMLRFGSGYLTQDVAAHVFTGNHLSVSCHLIPVGNDGKRTFGPVQVHHMPTFASVDGGKPAIGDVSPIALTKEENQFYLSLVTPAGHVWKKAIEVLQASEHATQMVGLDQAQTVFKSIASPCVSSFQVLILRPDCQENCLMCTVPRGAGNISEHYQAQVSEVFDILIDEVVASGHAFQQTLTGGSLSAGDGGFATAHAWGMEILAAKVAAKEAQIHKKIPVQIQLEMVLPKDQSTWPEIIDTLAHYTTNLGWKISLAINTEVIQESWEPVFIQGAIKSATTVEDHVNFAKALKEGTHGAVVINSLVMFGMKPVGMDAGEYMTADLLVLQQMVAAGIKPDYQPVKIEAGSKLEAYPSPNPVHLMVQDAALKQMIAQAKLPWSPGCVGGCNACDQSHETNQLLIAAKQAGVSLSDLFKPLLQGLGGGYEKAYQQLFPSFAPGSKGLLYEKHS